MEREVDGQRDQQLDHGGRGVQPRDQAGECRRHARGGPAGGTTPSVINHRCRVGRKKKKKGEKEWKKGGEKEGGSRQERRKEGTKEGRKGRNTEGRKGNVGVGVGWGGTA